MRAAGGEPMRLLGIPPGKREENYLKFIVKMVYLSRYSPGYDIDKHTHWYKLYAY